MANPPTPNEHDCLICLDSLPRDDLIHLPCDHYLCGPCTQRGWSLAIKNEANFPFACCSEPIPCSTVAKFVSAEDRIAYNAKREEYYTIGPRTYCSYPNCSTFIPEILIEGRIALCPKCQLWTCRKCQKPDDHVPYANCPPAAAENLEALRKAAREQGWQTCPNCGDLRELRDGCYHMRCTCNAEFCFNCQARWRTCNCRQYPPPRRRAARPGGPVERLLRGTPRVEPPPDLARRLRFSEDNPTDPSVDFAALHREVERLIATARQTEREQMIFIDSLLGR